MLSGEKVLITCHIGRVAFPLAADNEIWGVARFSDPAICHKRDALGVTTRVFDTVNGDHDEARDCAQGRGDA